jgi:hypothetical protein
MTAKKSMRGVALDGKTLRYSHGNIGLFGQAGYEKLLELNRIPKGALIEAEVLIASYLDNASILELALFYGLEADQPYIDLDDMSSLVDAWIEAGHSLLDLHRKIIEAFKMATNPPGVAPMLENWKISDRKAEVDEKINKEIEKEKIEGMEKVLRDVKEAKEAEKEKEKKTDGPSSPVLVESS